MLSCVLLADESALGSQSLAQGFATWRGTPQIDGARASRAAWGILGEKLQPEEAQACAAAFEACGVATRTLAMPEPPALPQPVTVRAVSSMSETGLDLETTTGRQGAMRYDELALIAAAVLVERSVRIEETTQGPGLASRIVKTGITMTTGIPLGGRKTTVESEVAETRDVLRCDLYLRAAGRRVRFDFAALNFSFLGAAKTYSLHSNYRTFIRLILERAPAAGRTVGAALMFSGRPNAKAGYESEADYERECRWRCALMGLTAPR